MNLKKIIGQLFIIGFQGNSISVDSPIARDIVERNLGGVILFDRFLAEKKPINNIISKKQLIELNKTLQDLASGSLFICIDQEGGKVSRLKKEFGFPTFPSAQEVSESSNPEIAISCAKETAALLAELGFNFNFAPVADLNINPSNPIIGRYQRSYSAIPEKVAHHCTIWIEQHRKLGILSCLKHFPGHGSSTVDSHLGFVDISESWQEKELSPYEHLIQNNMTESVMMGHLYHSRLDSEYPASLSKKIISRLLREELHFDGLVISDDIQMKAITNQYSVEEASLIALAAGADMIIIGNNLRYDPHILKKSTLVIERAVESGSLPLERLMNAYERIQKVKGTIAK